MMSLLSTPLLPANENVFPRNPLCREQGRHEPGDQKLGLRVGARWHPSERHRAVVHEDALDRAGASRPFKASLASRLTAPSQHPQPFFSHDNLHMDGTRAASLANVLVP